jgi:hypothetical protein
MKVVDPTRPDIKARRKILAGAGVGLLSLFSFFKSGLFTKKKPVIDCPPPSEKKETMKVLSQDGQLVEVDISKIKRTNQKISNEELQHWIKKG